MAEQGTIFLVLLLIYYRATKKYKEKPVDGFWQVLDQNVVEIIFAGILIPDVVGLAVKHMGNLL